MFASVDIGTNTALLLVAEFCDGRLHVVREEQRVPRLGKGVDKDRNLSDESMNRVIASLKEYQQILNSHYKLKGDVIVTATSAVRDANNRDHFCGLVENEIGWKVRILTGSEEAEWTFTGALSMVNTEADEDVMIIDIGGGSTELGFGNGNQLLDAYSYNMGSVRFTERYLKHNPPLPAEMNECRYATDEMLNSRPFLLKGAFRAIGVAGTVTSLAFIKLDLERYKPEKISGYQLSTTVISDFIKQFSVLSSQELENKYPVVMQGRADIMVAGLLILDGFLKKYQLESIMVSTGGIRHGAIIKSFS